MEIDQLGRLRDIREACLLVESYVAGVSSGVSSRTPRSRMP